jgi:hypothetical protein
MKRDGYLKSVAIMVRNGFRLKGEIWDELPWDGDMPDDLIEVFASIIMEMENEKLSKLIRV